MSARSEDRRVAAALARNERYVREFVEAFSLCPYAQRCREMGRLHRAVLLETGGAPGTTPFELAAAALDDAIARIEDLAPESVEVALILLPALDRALVDGLAGAQNFEQLVATARARMQARRPGGDTPFYCVAFHPNFAEDLTDAHRAVRFLRRSPDPTVQLVRASVLREVRGANPGGANYVNVTGMSAAELLAVAAPMSIGDRIAAANLRTIEEMGRDHMRRILADLRDSREHPEGGDPTRPPRTP